MPRLISRHDIHPRKQYARYKWRALLLAAGCGIVLSAVWAPQAYAEGAIDVVSEPAVATETVTTETATADASATDTTQGIFSGVRKMMSAPSAGEMIERHAADIKFLDAAAMDEFYAARDNKPYWAKNASDLRAPRAMAGLIQEAWQHGLNPARYHADEIQELLVAPQAKTLPRLELLLTDAAMRYVRDMTGARANFAALGLGARYWRKAGDALTIAHTLGAERDIPAYLQSLPPRGAIYGLLQKALVEAVNEGAGRDHLLPLNFGGGLFKPRSTHPHVKKLRAYLGQTHDPSYGPENYYDDRLAAAVMAYQEARQLSPDGILGPSTLTVMNRTHKDRIHQIIANLERLRWLPAETASRHMIVNIPSQRLWAIDDGRVVAEMDVIVGMPTRQTKQFITEVTGVRFNPTWTVPLSLKMADFKPKLMSNPGYLHDVGINVIRDGKSIDPYSIDWASVGAREMNAMRFVQKPGDHNALGRVRILMPSDYDIYLHDTNHPEFFDRTQRALSSGCVRVSDPMAVADFILKHNDDWDEARLNRILDGGRMTEVSSRAPFPIYIMYQTIWQGDNGRLVFGPDIYQQDSRLIEQLARNKAFALPAGDVDLAADG